MTEKSRTTDDVENSKNFPMIDFYDIIDEYLYELKEVYDSSDYRNWYHRYVIDNYQLNTRIFILHDPKAIKIFEKIINNGDFLEHVVLFLDEFKPCRNFISKNFPKRFYKQSPMYKEISPCHAKAFTANIIIPEKYNTINEYDIITYDDLIDFFRDNPIKINFRVGYSIARFDDHLVFKFY